MFGLKKKFRTSIHTILSRFIKESRFPNHGIPQIVLDAYLKRLEQTYDIQDIKNNFTWLHTLPHPFAKKIYSNMLTYNTNHLGNWTTAQSRPQGTQLLERDLIRKMIDLYHAGGQGLEGYVTSGGTESNIFLTWIGRTKLEQYYSSGQLTVIYTNLTHYSILKAARVAGIKAQVTPLNPQTWSLDSGALHDTISALWTKGQRGFIIPLTLGYTVTGTSDRVAEIITTVRDIEKKFKNAKFFIWIDAASYGLVAPFLISRFAPFSSPYIQALLVDFHKFGQTPYPSGIVLYRKPLRALIEKPIDYLPENDNTLLGSRQGAAAASMWAMMHIYGREGFRTLMQSRLELKNTFINRLKHIYPDIEIITDDLVPSCGIIFHSLTDSELPAHIVKTYGLFVKPSTYIFAGGKKRQCAIYKFYFLPHIQSKFLNAFLNDMEKLKKTKL